MPGENMHTTTDRSKIVVLFNEEGFVLDYEALGKKEHIDEALQEKLYEAYLCNPIGMLYELGYFDAVDGVSESVKYLYEIASLFVHELSRRPEIEFTRERTELVIDDDEINALLQKMPYVLGIEYVTADWIRNIHGKLMEVFSAEITGYPGMVSEYLNKQNSHIEMAGRVFFHMVENKESDYPFAFLATYSKKKKGKKKAIHTPLKNALIEFKNDHEKLLKLLSTVSKAVNKSEFIGRIVDSGEIFMPIGLSVDEAYTFLKEVEIYEDCGILCRIPDFWKKKSNKITLSIKIGEKEPSKVGIDALMAFNPFLSLDGQEITEDELKMLMNQTQGLMLLKGKWVEVDHEKIEQILSAFEKSKELASTGVMTVAEAMRLHMDINKVLGEEEGVEIEITNGQWLENVIERLNQRRSLTQVSLGDEFKTTLRHYQEKGLSWLYSMYELGFGACLADDMGLGKTVQVIALLEVLRTRTNIKTMLVVPASLMGNWEKELNRFAPEIKYKMIYNKKDVLKEDEDDYDVLITTYGMVSRREDLNEKSWDILILDEAQAIKNPGTKQTKAVKKIKARARIALTGTPIENSLSDLWSLFDFLNGGLLGTATEFKRFMKRLNQEHEDYKKLRSIVNPFILRRLKTDKNVITELPEKIEIKTYTPLSKKQVTLYDKTLKELMNNLQNAKGIQRRGMVLASITKFKQICNHPDHYLSQDDFDIKYSGKFERLKEIAETVYQKRERILVFTQYREMTEPLAKFLETIFSREGRIIHGGTPVKKRTRYVEDFQGEDYIPFMVLSLKAGGVGLNLTNANHVIHFDRWWNPAVENQATDRAFRIGQKKNVIVHKFITKGTIEEKIDEMIESKMALSNDVLATGGENWITEMDNEKIFEMFSLDRG
jgi:non-specific serine/threonine protein kinase